MVLVNSYKLSLNVNLAMNKNSVKVFIQTRAIIIKSYGAAP
jgi:hypothetical protein